MGFQWAVVYHTTIHSGSLWIWNLKDAWNFVNLWHLKDARWVQENEFGASRSTSFIEATLQDVHLGSYPSSKCQIPHRVLGNNRKLVRALLKWPHPAGVRSAGRTLPRSPASPQAPWRTERPTPGGQMCMYPYVCHSWFVCGARQRLGFWLRKGDRFITKCRIRSFRAGARIDKGSPLFAFLSSYSLRPLPYLMAIAFVKVSGFYPYSVFVICLGTASLCTWSLLKHQKFFPREMERKKR